MPQLIRKLMKDMPANHNFYTGNDGRVYTRLRFNEFTEKRLAEGFVLVIHDNTLAELPVDLVVTQINCGDWCCK